MKAMDRLIMQTKQTGLQTDRCIAVPYLCLTVFKKKLRILNKVLELCFFPHFKMAENCAAYCGNFVNVSLSLFLLMSPWAFSKCGSALSLPELSQVQFTHFLAVLPPFLPISGLHHLFFFFFCFPCQKTPFWESVLASPSVPHSRFGHWLSGHCNSREDSYAA